MDTEIWKRCGESSRCFYEISNHGRVRSFWKKSGLLNGICKCCTNTNGYLYIQISKKCHPIHHLVMYAFNGERPEDMIIEHVDSDKLNNYYENLRYRTQYEKVINRDYTRHDIKETDKKIRHNIICKEYRESDRGKQKNKDKNRKYLDDKYECPCGSITNRHHKTRHEKSDKHKKYLETLF